MNTTKLLWAIDDHCFDVYSHRIITHILRRGVCYATNGRQIVKSMNGGMSHVKAGKVLAELEASGAIALTMEKGIEGYKVNADFFAESVNEVYKPVNDINTGVNVVNANVNRVNANVNGVYTEEETLRINNKNKPNKREKEEKPIPPHLKHMALIDALNREGIQPKYHELAKAMKAHCNPVKTDKLLGDVWEAIGHDITVDEVKGLSNGYWGIYGIGDKPWPSQVSSHIEPYRQWVRDGKPSKKNDPKNDPKNNQQRNNSTAVTLSAEGTF